MPKGPSVDPAGEVAACAVVADVLFGSFGAAADGGDRLQHPLPLVRGAELGRAGLGCNDVYEKPRPIAGSGGGKGVSGPGGGASTRGGADFRRALYGGWDASGGVSLGDHPKAAINDQVKTGH